MNKLELLLSVVGVTVFFIFFLQWWNSNVLKEIRVYKDVIKGIKKSNIGIPNYEVIMQKAKRHHVSWHYGKGFLYILLAFVIGGSSYFVIPSTFHSIILFLISGLLLWGPGDMFQNYRMKWDTFELGDKSGTDIIPFWARFAMLGISLFIYIIL